MSLQILGQESFTIVLSVHPEGQEELSSIDLTGEVQGLATNDYGLAPRE